MIKKTVPVEAAVGLILPHDITEIRADEFKGRAFKKGHVIRPEDILHLKRLGKDKIYLLELGEDEIHENEAAHLLASALCGTGVSPQGEPVEGKIAIGAVRDGLLKINADALYRFNLLGEVMCATLHNNTPVKKGEILAATRLIPLACKRKLIDRATGIAKIKGRIIRVIPFQKKRVGIVIIGNEVFHGRIQDGFAPILQKKMEQMGSEVITIHFAPDDEKLIAKEIRECVDARADLIITSGGMSVDPDDVTRIGIARAGTTKVVYGSPVLPGAMFLIGYLDSIPILGIPACAMFHKITILDLVLPRILTGEKLTRPKIARLGHGGLCRTCPTCHFPACPFGR